VLPPMTIQCQYHWLLSLRGGRVTPVIFCGVSELGMNHTLVRAHNKLVRIGTNCPYLEWKIRPFQF
ncbi:MAG: hypothetical protein BECKG1743E_GA0114224_103491, partial [Candidatus Kentron sp. G]